MKHEISHLPENKWRGTVLPLSYTTNEVYDVSFEKKADGYDITIQKNDLKETVTHSSLQDDGSDRLYADDVEKGYAWGILIEEKLVAAIETAPETWSNRLRITELWVADAFQNQGIGHALIEIAKEQARHERRRAIILETQSSNVNAIDFHHHEGFSLTGLDVCSYTNEDIDRKEVRLEFG
ncbi:MAG: GNAT family N-acetyltransferase [Alkalibacterium sp.]|nr:GNAT family N-acetyltransferase [Alkalibacterium sp.]